MSWSCLIAITLLNVLTSGDKVNVSKNCGNIHGIHTENSILIQSPNYPQNPPSNSQCEIVLKDQNFPVQYKFDFIDFDLDSSPGCSKDRIEIGRLDALCGKQRDSKIYQAINGTLNVKFITGARAIGRGFKILVEKVMNEPQFLNKTHYPPNFNECFTTSAQFKHFFIKSPNFPYSLSYPSDCVIRIKKFSSNICRMRMKLNFFWFGSSMNCIEGFLQIDGKFICGCRKEMKIISDFPEDMKILRFRSEGLVKNSYSGFYMEVFQDDCPKKIRDISERKLEKRSFLTKQPIVRELYFFTYPGDPYYSYNNKDREEVDYVDIKDADVNISNNNQLNECLLWNQIQFDHIYSRGKTDSQQYGSTENWYNERNCIDFYSPIGVFFSPGYPLFILPRNVTCYRFFKLPGQCRLSIYFLDFRIPTSPSCSDDRLGITSTKEAFCGTSLWNKMVTLDFTNGLYEEIIFQTKESRCLLGFKAIFKQLPCSEMRSTTTSPMPVTSILPTPDYPVTERKPSVCGGVIKKWNFTLTNDLNNDECQFFIEKYTTTICRLKIYFEEMNMNCSLESLLINNIEYCKHSKGETELIDFKEVPVEIIYRRMPAFTTALRFKIIIMQENCFAPEPPAQIS